MKEVVLARRPGVHISKQSSHCSLIKTPRIAHSKGGGTGWII